MKDTCATCRKFVRILMILTAILVLMNLVLVTKIDTHIDTFLINKK